MTEPQQPTPQKAEKGTSYVILEVESGNAEGRCTIVATITATSANAAIREAGEDAGAGTYIAVPARSFVPTKVTVETSKVLKLGPA